MLLSLLCLTRVRFVFVFFVCHLDLLSANPLHLCHVKTRLHVCLILLTVPLLILLHLAEKDLLLQVVDGAYSVHDLHQGFHVLLVSVADLLELLSLELADFLEVVKGSVALFDQLVSLIDHISLMLRGVF